MATHTHHYCYQGMITLECEIEFIPGEGDGFHEQSFPDIANLISAEFDGTDFSELLAPRIITAIEEDFLSVRPCRGDAP